MKSMNEMPGTKVGMKEKIMSIVGEGLVRMAADPRGCTFLTTYEPEIPYEILEDMYNKN